MKFRTAIDIDPRHKGEISLDQSLIMLGSCFTTNIGERLLRCGFDVSVNPFGTLYNPLSIEHSISNAISLRNYTEKDLVTDPQGICHCLDFHSAFSSDNPETVIMRANQAIHDCHEKIKACHWLIITLGTSYVYTWKANGEVVANCHKLHPDDFERILMSPSEVEASLDRLIKSVRSVNNDAKFIFTVSPIRHKTDGLHANQISKASLLLAIDHIKDKHDNVIYFPAYEIMMDDLRDYRFYDEDMVHPSQVAIKYIYEMFADMFMSDKTINQCSANAKAALRLLHRPIVK